MTWTIEKDAMFSTNMWAHNTCSAAFKAVKPMLDSFGRGGQTDPTSCTMISDNTEITVYPWCLERKSLACARAWGQTDRSNMRTKKMLDDVGLNAWLDSNFIEHRPTSSNTTQHGGHTSPTLCAEQCWVTMLGSFGQGLFTIGFKQTAFMETSKETQK